MPKKEMIAGNDNSQFKSTAAADDATAGPTRRRRPGAGRPRGAAGEKIEVCISRPTKQILDALVSLGQASSSHALASKILTQGVENARGDLQRAIDSLVRL